MMFLVPSMDPGGVGSSSSIPPAPDVFLMMLTGESNSRGFALSSELTAGELAVRNMELIGDESTSAFAALDVGTNNSSVYTPDRHGLEVSLANYFDDGVWGSYDFGLVKSGFGGSQIGQWAVDSAGWNTMIARKNVADAAYAGQSIRWVFVWSQGINDALGTGAPTWPALSAADWKAATIAHFAAARTAFADPEMTIAFIGFPDAFAAGNPTYVTALDEIVAADPYTYKIDATGAGLIDTNHFNASGFKTLGDRLMQTLFSVDLNLRQLGPAYSVQLADVAVTEGNNATLSATALSLSSVTLQLQKSDDGVSYTNVSGATSSPFTIPSVTITDDDGDNYRVQANAYGRSRASRVATLTVNPVPSFDPSVDLAAKLVAWLRADYGTYQDMAGTTTPATADTDEVKTWDCKIGSGLFTANASGNADPGFERFRFDAVDANGQPALHSTVQNWKIASVNQYTVKSMVAVAKYDGATITADFPGLIGQLGTNAQSLIGGATGATTWLASVFLTWPYRLNGTVDASRNMPMNAAGICEISSSTAFTDYVIIGNHRGNPLWAWNGWIYEVLLLDDELTAGERTALNNYLAARYGITL